jgi:hypothetical protein
MKNFIKRAFLICLISPFLVMGCDDSEGVRLDGYNVNVPGVYVSLTVDGQPKTFIAAGFCTGKFVENSIDKEFVQIILIDHINNEQLHIYLMQPASTKKYDYTHTFESGNLSPTCSSQYIMSGGTNANPSLTGYVPQTGFEVTVNSYFTEDSISLSFNNTLIESDVAAGALPKYKSFAGNISLSYSGVTYDLFPAN